MGKKILFFVMAVCMLFTMSACGNEQKPPEGEKPTVGGGEVTASYGIYFYTDKGKAGNPMLDIKAGSKITEPEGLTYPNYEFLGWYTDYGVWQDKFVWDTMPDHDVVLYANWKSNVADSELQAYEDELNAKSENGHLYIHYMRFDNTPKSYENMSLWVWPSQKTGKTFNWEKDSSGKVIVDEIGGAVCDIDLTKKYTGAGNSGTETQQYFIDDACDDNYKPEYIKDKTKYNDPKIGFLIVYDDSKNSGSHWKSDCGNQYFEIDGNVRVNGSIHVFATQDNVKQFVFYIANKGEISNPYENDDGSHVSKSDVVTKDWNSLQATADPKNLFDTVSGVGYQIMVSSFADSDGDGLGDIQGILDNLDYLDKDLNVDVLWLTPIQESDSYHGYDIIDYCSVDPKFGTMEQYQELLDECHKRGMKVIMDLVLNHTSMNNVWFQKSAKMVKETGEDGKVVDYRNFYHWRNHETEKLTSTWYAYSEYAYSYYAKFGTSMPELNYDYTGTRNAVLDVTKFWLDMGVDGFRMDAVKHIYMQDEVTPSPSDIIISDYDEATKTDYSTNVTKNMDFFCWLIDGIKKINPNAYVVGENFDGHAYNVAPYYKAFDGMLDFYSYYNLAQIAGHMGWAQGFAGQKRAGEPGGDQEKIAEITGTNTNKLLTNYWNLNDVMKTNAKYGNQVTNSLFTSNHDVHRLLNNVAGGLTAADVVTAATANEAKQRALTTIAAMMTLPGISWIYYGDELGMSSNYGTGESKTSPHVDRQYRQPFKWSKSAGKYTTSYSIPGDKTYYVEWDSYNKTLPGVAEQKATNGSFLKEVMGWTKLKSEDPVIRYGDYTYCSFDNNGDIMSFKRSYEGKTYWVICNFGRSEYGNPGRVFGSRAKLIHASNGASLSYLPVGGSMVVEI
ncbi:MAG: InlB B-repeat-containing protein [Clostridia bacterium]|nr:InlB B-repeat-containing protein [Clostridia bacterium]